MEFKDIKKIGIAGAGTMGSGIALIFARKGYEVILTDIADTYLEKSKKLVEIYNNNLVEEGLMTREEADKLVKIISYSTDKTDFKDADLIIEAIIEKMDIKQDFWKEVEEIAKPKAIFATNTSGLSINAISEKVINKGRFIGMHFWNPPHIIPLVELIRTINTTDETIETLKELLTVIDKESVVVQKDAPGFIGNRLQFAAFREALNIVNEGIASAEDVDKAMKYGPGFRYPIIGPLQTADFGGLDTFLYISSYLFNALSDMKQPPEVLQSLVDANKLGVKSKEGFYDYSDGKDEEAIRNRDKMFFKMLKYIHLEKN